MIGVLYFFGCWGDRGHYLHTPNGSHLWKDVGPFSLNSLDSGYAPKSDTQDQRITSLVHREGWTALAMWDRTGDNRMGSNAVFVTQGVHDEKTMWQAVATQFPSLFRRLVAAPKL